MSNHKPVSATWSPDQCDCALERLWAELEDIPMDPRTERMEARFLHFPAGTERKDIWRWFNERYSQGIVSLLYGGDSSCVSQMEQSACLKELCPKCSLDDCTHSCAGVCYASLILGRNPQTIEGGKCSAYMRGDGT